MCKVCCGNTESVFKNIIILINQCPSGVHPGHRAGRDRGDRAGGAGAADAVEDGDHHPRPPRVRALREGTHDGQVGHGESRLPLLIIIKLICSSNIDSQRLRQ